MASSRINLPPDSLLFIEGDPPGPAYLIEEGQVEVSARVDGKDRVLCHLGPGELLGEMAVIDDAPRTASARALSAVRLTEIRREQIHERLSDADPVLGALVAALLQRYRSGLRAVRGAPELAPAAPLPVDPLRGPTLDSDRFDKFRLESQLRSALESGALEVVYQPILDIEPGRVAGYEALTRWRHAERGSVSPAEFIALAEETSLIVPVGEYVLDRVCSTLNQLHRAGDDSTFVAVNVSTKQLAFGDFPDRLLDLAQRHRVPTQRLKVEVTESMTLDFDSVRELLSRLHECGFAVALDDFGTGYSSLARLHHLDFDTIKLDQAFTRQMLDQPRCMSIVRGIVAMGHELGCDFVVEGVETTAQLETVRALGCRYAQGWLIGKPAAMPAAAHGC